jgi:hypothetical protein
MVGNLVKRKAAFLMKAAGNRKKDRKNGGYDGDRTRDLKGHNLAL